MFQNTNPEIGRFEAARSAALAGTPVIIQNGVGLALFALKLYLVMYFAPHYNDIYDEQEQKYKDLDYKGDDLEYAAATNANNRLENDFMGLPVKAFMGGVVLVFTMILADVAVRVSNRHSLMAAGNINPETGPKTPEQLRADHAERHTHALRSVAAAHHAGEEGEIEEYNPPKEPLHGYYEDETSAVNEHSAAYVNYIWARGLSRKLEPWTIRLAALSQISIMSNFVLITTLVAMVYNGYVNDFEHKCNTQKLYSDDCDSYQNSIYANALLMRNLADALLTYPILTLALVPDALLFIEATAKAVQMMCTSTTAPDHAINEESGQVFEQVEVEDVDTSFIAGSTTAGSPVQSRNNSTYHDLASVAAREPGSVLSPLTMYYSARNNQSGSFDSEEHKNSDIRRPLLPRSGSQNSNS